MTIDFSGMAGMEWTGQLTPLPEESGWILTRTSTTLCCLEGNKLSFNVDKPGAKPLYVIGGTLSTSHDDVPVAFITDGNFIFRFDNDGLWRWRNKIPSKFEVSLAIRRFMMELTNESKRD